MNENTWSAKFNEMLKKTQLYGSGPKKLDRRPREIEDEDPIEAGRGGACHLALEVLLLEFYSAASPYRLTAEGRNDFDHVFLMVNDRPMDIGGFTTIDELRKWYKDDALVPVPTTIEQIQQRFSTHCSADEKRRYKKLFRYFISEHRHDLFPK
jgi:hypothetical protein